MTVYNKLKIAILAILSSQHLYAITLDPLQIQSAPGELLYAEMSFHQANTNDKLDVSLATPEDLLMLGATHQPPANLNFYTRRNGQGEGVIVITSSRPMTEAELNIIVKIQEGNATHLKHIQQPIRQNNGKTTLAKTNSEKALTPKFIVSEKDIALNLPESTHFNASTSETKTPILKQEQLLNVSSVLPPALNTETPKILPSIAVSATAPSTITTQSTSISASANIPIPKAEPQPEHSNTQQVPTEVTAQTTTPLSNTSTDLQAKQEDTVKKVQQQSQAEQVKNPPVTATKKVAETPVASPNMQQHIVQRNESLWSIAQRIAVQNQQPVTQVMNQIKAQNQQAFIGGNANRLRQGSQLNFSLNVKPDHINQVSPQLAQSTRPASGTAKYRLQQAEMSLVAESQQDSSTGTAKKDTLQQKTNADLSLKVMTAREKTVTLQRNVTQLELTLRQKEQRIQLLNARLAELQEQLKAQQAARKPAR